MAGTLLLSVQEAEIGFGDKILFQDLGFNIHEGAKICLVGKNGAGKTTLMNIITGARELDMGRRWLLAGTTIGYLRQDIKPVAGQTVFDFIFEEMPVPAADDAAHYEQNYKIERVVQPLDLDLAARMDHLSGGQMRRAALARALVESPDILLLDEPTNHLDLDVIEWLEGYVRSYRGAVVCVSHDKTFLANISNQVFWLDRGSLRVCPKGFAQFDDWAVALLEQEERELHNRQKVLNQEVEWASRGVKARRKRNVRRVELMKQEREKLRADKNALARMMARIEFTPLDPAPVASRSVAEFHQVCLRYGDAKTILDKFNFRVLRGDRIGIVGKNGSGKTSFLKLLTGEIKADAGRVKLAKEIAFSYFDQARVALKPDQSLWRTLCPDGSDYIEVMGKSRHVCGYLKDFLFDPRLATAPVGTLSGGQKNRLLLAKTLANPGSLLILDEPTNDLDMDTLDMLEDILTRYTGTLLIVSHDRDFLDQSVTKILAFEGDGVITGHIGGYSDYRATKKQAQLAPTAEGKSGKTRPAPEPPTPNPQPRLSYKVQFELDGLPEKIRGLEKEIGELEDQLEDATLYERDAALFERLSKRLAAAQGDRDAAETRWLELDGMREA